MLFHAERDEVAYFMRRLYRQGLTTTSGGNLSRRVADDAVVISASKSDKAELKAEQVAIIGTDGENRTPELSPSIETSMHLEVYRRNPEVSAIVHAHPVTASAFCATKVPLITRYTAEGYAILRDPVFLPYALMGSTELAQIVAEGFAGNTLCALMENHGVITIGKTLLQAFDRIEVLETAARHTVILNQLGESCRLDDNQLKDIDQLMGHPPKKEA